MKCVHGRGKESSARPTSSRSPGALGGVALRWLSDTLSTAVRAGEVPTIAVALTSHEPGSRLVAEWHPPCGRTGRR